MDDITKLNTFLENCVFTNPSNTRSPPPENALYIDPLNMLSKNIMSIPKFEVMNCSRYEFTTGQIGRMNGFLDGSLADIVNTFPVTITNIYNGVIIPDNQNQTSSLSIDGKNVNSGDIAYLNEEKTYAGRTKQERFINYQGNNIKHNDWDNNPEVYHLLENFQISSSQPAKDAVFRTMNEINNINAIAENTLTINNDDVIIEFKDPWYLFTGSVQKQNQNDAWISNDNVNWLTGAYNQSTGGSFLGELYNPAEPNKPYYSVRVPVSQQIQINNRQHSFYLHEWTGNSAVTIVEPNDRETPVVFNAANSTITAILKGTNLSDETTAYDNNSQRKFVRTGSGDLHSVYTSLGSLWYERSTDGGSTWEILNSGYPLNKDNPKAVSIAYLQATNVVAIVYQHQTASGSKIAIDVLKDGLPIPPLANHYTVLSLAHSTNYDDVNLEPVITFTEIGGSINRDFMVVYKVPYIFPPPESSSDEGLYYSMGYLYGSGYSLDWYASHQDVFIDNTDANSNTPSLTGDIQTEQGQEFNFFHLVYEKNLKIYYWFSWGQLGTGSLSTVNTPYNLSAGTGSKTNTNPSISVANGYPVVSWTGEFKNVAEKISAKETAPLWKKQLFARRGEAIISPTPGSNWFTIQKTGNNVNFTNNNSMISTSDEYTVFTWDEGTAPVTKWFKRMNGSYGGNHLLSHSGIQTQVTDGNTLEEMTAMVFNTDNVPYFFTKSTSDFSIAEEVLGGMGKITDENQLTYGREGIVTKDGVEFVFNTGDVFVGDSIIKFTSRPDTIPITSEADLNEAVRTEDFHLDENSNFYFTNFYYVIHQEYADSVLTENDAVNFKAELVNAATDEVIGTYDNVTYNLNNLEEYDNVDYQVNCSGIEAGDYYLRLVTTVQEQAEYTLANVQDDNIDLAKKNYTEVLFNGESLPEVYELSQNYPNPFNPSTTIRYQLPESGKVNLIIYDILGREVTTLVDEFKTEGRYEVNFNASSLASGVYLYRLQVNDYVAVKKMMMIK